MEYQDSKIDDLFAKADDLIKDRRIGEAKKILFDVVSEAPDHGRAHNHLGWIFETQEKNYEKAVEHYSLALKFAPHYPSVYYNYAIVLSTTKKFDELRELLDKAIKVPGINFATIYNEYAIMHESLGEYDDAIEYYKLYIKNLFDNKQIDTAISSIERCKKKKEVLG